MHAGRTSMHSSVVLTGGVLRKNINKLQFFAGSIVAIEIFPAGCAMNIGNWSIDLSIFRSMIRSCAHTLQAMSTVHSSTLCS